MDRGLSQNALAEGICSASAISRWEAGVHLPPEDAIWSLANRLGIDVSVLTGLGFDTRFAESPDSCLLYTSPSPRDQRGSRMPSSA